MSQDPLVLSAESAVFIRLPGSRALRRSIRAPCLPPFVRLPYSRVLPEPALLLPRRQSGRRNHSLPPALPTPVSVHARHHGDPCSDRPRPFFGDSRATRRAKGGRREGSRSTSSWAYRQGDQWPFLAGLDFTRGAVRHAQSESSRAVKRRWPEKCRCADGLRWELVGGAGPQSQQETTAAGRRAPKNHQVRDLGALPSFLTPTRTGAPYPVPVSPSGVVYTG